MHSLLASNALLACLVAQSPVLQGPNESLPKPFVPIHTAAADPIGGDGGTWAAAGDYKVQFGDAVTFVPYLGAHYPHNQPFAWRTTAVTIGDVALPLARRPGRARSASQWTRDLGVAEERWHVREQGLEQSFWFAARPGDGELRIRGELTTALRAPVGDHGHRDVAFADGNGDTLLRYGACTAIDADGRRWPMRTEVGDGWIELVLAADAAAAARWPVLVDPLLAPVLLSTDTTPPLAVSYASDVARDDENNQLLVAFERSASGTDADVFVQLSTDGYASYLGQVFADVTASWSTTAPKVAFVGGADRWLTAFTRQFVGGTLAVRWHAHDAADVLFDATVGFLTPAGGTSDLNPDVGGYAGFATGVHALLCWQRDQNLGAGGTHTSDPNSRVHFARIDLSVAGAGTAGAQIELIGADPSAVADRERPSVNRQSGGLTTSDFLIAWQTYWNAAPGGVDDWDVEGKRVDSAGALLPGVWISSSNFPNGDHKLGPIVDGSADEYVIAYTLADNTIIPSKTSSVLGSRVAVESYDFAAPAIGAPQTVYDTGFVKSQVVTGLSYDTLTRSHAVVVHHDLQLNRLWVRKLGYRNKQVESWLAYNASPVFGGGAAYDDDAQRHAFVFSVDNGVDQPVLGRMVTYDATPAPLVYGNAGCQVGSIGWSGFHRLGHQHGALQISGAAPSSIALAAYSLAPANAPIGPFGFGNCILLIDPLAPAFIGSSALITGPTGFASLGIPVFEDLAPFECYFQWLVFPTGSFADTEATAGLQVVFAR